VLKVFTSVTIFESKLDNAFFAAFSYGKAASRITWHSLAIVCDSYAYLFTASASPETIFSFSAAISLS